MLEIKGVKKSYGEFQLDCSLNVEKGRITGLVGENGAGKSTLFKAVLGLISYDAGEIKICLLYTSHLLIPIITSVIFLIYYFFSPRCV